MLPGSPHRGKSSSARPRLRGSPPPIGESDGGNIGGDGCSAYIVEWYCGGYWDDADFSAAERCGARLVSSVPSEFQRATFSMGGVPPERIALLPPPPELAASKTRTRHGRWASGA